VADFGLAKSTSGSSKNGFENRQFGGTKAYMTPELIMKLSYSPMAADLFAFGVVLFILKVGKMPFTTASSEDYFYRYII
jgi:serine/threonine protein kinase